MKVNLQFDFVPRCSSCEVSLDLWDDWKGQKGPRYASIRLPSYEPEVPHTVVSECKVNDSLPFGSIKVAAKLFHVRAVGPTVSQCEFTALNHKPPVLKSVTILLKTSLYIKLMQLSDPIQRLEFLELKYGLRHLETVIYDGYTVEPSWSRVSFCAPYSEGLIDFRETQVVFVTDKMDTLSEEDIIYKFDDEMNIAEVAHPKVELLALQHPVPVELISPTPAATDDDSMFVFADFHTLLSFGITSGSYIKIKNEHASRIVKVFILVAPHNFRSSVIYAPPRIVASFSENFEISISKHPVDDIQLPTAFSVSIARVGSWDQTQKVYQNIILLKLKDFFASKRRVLQVGDMLPISFDSGLATLYTEEFDFKQPDDTPDSLVWFYVESVRLSDRDEISSETEFVIDPDKTKLVTANIVSKKLLRLSACDYISFFGLDPIFRYNLKKFPYAKKLLDILAASANCESKGISISTSVLLHSTSANTGKSSLVRFAALTLGLSLLHIDCMTLSTNVGSQDATAKIIGYLRGKIESVIAHTTPAVIFLSHIDILLTKADQNQDLEGSKASKNMDLEICRLIEDFTASYEGSIFIASATEVDSISANVRNSIKFELEVPVPNELQREAFFQWFLSLRTMNRGQKDNQRYYNIKKDVSFAKLSVQSAGLSPLDIETIANTAKYQCARRLCELDSESHWLTSAYTISMKDLNSAISKARDDFSVSIGAPKIPNVTWDDIGGMEQVKGEIMDTIDLPLKHPDLFASGMKKRSGVLFYGPPGTGKTLMAKAIATNFSLNFFSVKGPELLNMYIGESEANVRRVFQKAREAKPCVIFFDELDSVAPKRGNQGDSGGVMDRIVSQLLAELDGMGSSGEGVFVIGATNRPDLLDEALLRPGRFDKLLYLGIPDTNEKQYNIISTLTRKFTLSSDVDLLQVSENCPFNYTGADFYALCSDAMLNAMTRTAGEIDKKVESYNELHGADMSVRQWFDKIAVKEDSEVKVEMADFLKALREMAPSVSEDELKHYLRVKANFENAA